MTDPDDDSAEAWDIGGRVAALAVVGLTVGIPAHHLLYLKTGVKLDRRYGQSFPEGGPMPWPEVGAAFVRDLPQLVGIAAAFAFFVGLLYFIGRREQARNRQRTRGAKRRR